MKQRIMIFTAALLMAGTFTAAALAPHNAFCPVMPGHKVKEKFFTDYQGKRVNFCCRPCVKAFRRDPAKYLKNLS